MFRWVESMSVARSVWVSWITGMDTEADIDAFDDWQMSDSGYHEIVAETAGSFVENSGHTSLIEKIN